MTDRPLKSLRKPILVAVGLVAAATLLFASYSSGFGSPAPRRIPVAVAAPAALTRQLAASPALDVHPAGSPAQVRRLIEDRTVYGGLIVADGQGVQLDVADGAGHSVAQALTTAGGDMAKGSGAQLTVKDLAPLSPRDLSGSIEYFCIVMLTLASFIGASVLFRVMGPVRDLGNGARRVAFLASYTALLAAVFATVADVGLGALTGHAVSLFLIFWGYATAVCLAITGVASTLGVGAALVVIVTTIILGYPSAGGPVGRPLLNSFYSSLTPFLPPGSGLSMARGAQYFGGAGVAAAAPTLAVWGGVGLLLVAGAAVRRQRSRAEV